MTKYIAILRGINVGGHRKILMAGLREMFHNMGFLNIQSYIQSGNVIFDFDRKEKKHKIAGKIEKQIHETFGFNVPVIVRTAKEIRQAVSENPFVKEGVPTEGLYLTFLREIPNLECLEKIKTIDYSPDRIEIIGNNVFGFSSGKYSDSKYTNNFFEQKLKTAATTRNWKTVLKLLEMASLK